METTLRVQLRTSLAHWKHLLAATQSKYAYAAFTNQQEDMYILSPFPAIRGISENQ